ncbi:MAG: LamG-like jellyroll fold domain-containing protein, partial [Bacteroidota bacterium]
LMEGHIQAVVRLPSGIYSIEDSSRLPADSWSNIALVVERKAAYEPLELQLYRNADLVPAETKWVENPIMAFPNFTDKGLHFGGNSFAQFVYTRNYPPPGRDFTFECWIKPDTVSGHQPLWHTIMPIRTGNFGNIEIETFHAISLLHGGRLRAQLTLMDQDGRPTLAQAESEADLSRDQWAHVAVVGKFTPQGNTVQFIINGKAELPNSIDDGLPLWQQSLQILGRSTPQSGPFADRIRNFKGAIGQLRIWSSALEVNRIIRLASVPVTEGNPSPGGNFIPLKDRMPTGLTFDLHEWMVFSGNMNDEGGGYPAPGEVLHFGDVSTSGSPIKKLPETDKSFTETYRSYLLPNWSGQFHFGGLAPAKALKLGAKASYSCAPDRGMTLQTSQDSFTFECLIKTNQNGGVIWSTEDRDSDQFQFVGLDNGELGWSSGNGGNFEKMAVPQLFDDQWHLLSMRYDRSYAQSEDAWVHVYVDGESIGFGLASSQQLANRSPIRMGGLANPNDPTDRQLELAHVRFWAYQRSDDQIKAAQHQLPTGEELGLAAYWPLDNEELIDLGPDKLNLSAPYPAHFTDYPNPSFTNKGGLKGILAEVRIWNTALSKEYLRKSLFTPLVGREYRLAGNWRMGAIWEEEKKITDFSTQGNDGQVYGDVYLSQDSLRRRLGPTETAPLATTYRNEELVAVSARAIYEETLEFRLIGQDGKPVRNKRLAEKAFHFHFRGKKGRSNKKWIGHERFVSGIISEHIGESINPNAWQGDKDFGWYRAKCRFVVPDKVALLRVLGLHEVDGDWQRMEIRRHRLTHISEAISHVVYKNALDDLSTIGEAPVDTRKSRGLIRFFQNQIVSYRERLALLEDWIKKAEDDTFSFQQEVNKAEKAKDDAKNRLDQLKREWDNLHKKREILLTYKYRIKAKHSKKYLTLPRFYDPYRGLLSGYTPITQNNAHGRIADFVIEQADHKNQFHLRLADSENRYLAGLLNLPTIKEAKGSSLFAQTGRNSVVTKFGFAGSNFEFSSSSSKFQFFYGHSWADNLSSLETVKAAGTKAYRINVEETGLAVDITGSKKNNGAKCIQWTYNSPPSNNQFFHIEIQEGSSISSQVQSVQRAKAEAEQAYTIALNKYNTLKNQPRDKSNLESWIAERNELVAKIADAYIQISSSDENYKSAITELKALTLPPLSSDDPNELITKGAYLGFVEAKDQLFLYENCEGEVQLCYGDRFGRIRQTKYDVTADSRNPYFEEWVPDGPKLALKLEKDNSLIPNTKFQLGSEFTIEWWVNCQATHWEGDGDN